MKNVNVSHVIWSFVVFKEKKMPENGELKAKHDGGIMMVYH